MPAFEIFVCPNQWSLGANVVNIFLFTMYIVNILLSENYHLLGKMWLSLLMWNQTSEKWEEKWKKMGKKWNYQLKIFSAPIIFAFYVLILWRFTQKLIEHRFLQILVPFKVFWCTPPPPLGYIHATFLGKRSSPMFYSRLVFPRLRNKKHADEGQFALV